MKTKKEVERIIPEMSSQLLNLANHINQDMQQEISL